MSSSRNSDRGGCDAWQPNFRLCPRNADWHAALGTGPIADVFYAAFAFQPLSPPFCRRSVQCRLRAAVFQGDRGAWHGWRQALFRGGLRRPFSVLLLIPSSWKCPWPLLVRFIIAPGFADDADKFDLTVRLAAVMFPYLMCMSLTAMLSGMLNSLHHFFAADVAPIFLNLVMITALFYALTPARNRFRPPGISWSVLWQGPVADAGRLSRGTPCGHADRLQMAEDHAECEAASDFGHSGGDHRRRHADQPRHRPGHRLGKKGRLPPCNMRRIYQLPLGVVGVAVGVVLLPETGAGAEGRQCSRSQYNQTAPSNSCCF